MINFILQPHVNSKTLLIFFGKEFYFYFFGRNGFFESQILINSEKIEYFIGDFKKLLNQHNPIITLFSLKGMSGEQKYLRFEGKMICLTFAPEFIASTTLSAVPT